MKSRLLFGAFGLSLLLVAGVSAEGASPQAPSYERSREALELPMRAEDYSDVAEFTCSYSGGNIFYNGNTTLQLVNCLLEAPKESSKLVVTSSGGTVDLAIFAAHIVSEMALDVEVVGWCASSCANYILPAAKRVFLDQYSLVYVHGAPGPADREGLVVALAKIGITEDSPKFEKAISENLPRSELTYQLHNNFREKFQVGEYYYDLNDLAAARATEVQPGGWDLFFVDPDWLKRCLPGVEIIAEVPNIDGLRKLHPKRSLVAFSDIRGPDQSCFQ